MEKTKNRKQKKENGKENKMKDIYIYTNNL